MDLTTPQTASFLGLGIDEVRPYARTRQLDQLHTIAKDQARVWEMTTGIKVPPSSGAHSISATPHTHDGTTGEVVPIPLCQQIIGATLKASGADNGDYKPFHEPLVRVPPGVTRLRVIVYTTAAFAIAARVQTKNTSGTVLNGDFFTVATDAAGETLSNGATRLGLTEDDQQKTDCVYADISVTADSYVIVSLQYIDGSIEDFGLIPEVSVVGYSILPWLGAPLRVAPWSPPIYTSGEATVPTASQYRSGTADAAPFSSVDSALFTDGRSVNGYVTYSLALNDNLLDELVTGRPIINHAIGHTDDLYWKGHNHGDDRTAYNTNMLGDDMDQPLLAVSWGVGRTRPGTLAGAPEHATVDMVTATADEWEGGIFGPTSFTTRTTFADVGRYRLRMPSATAANIQAGTKIKLAVYGYLDTGIATTMECRVTLYTSDGATAGTSATLTWSSDGRAVQTGTLDPPGASGSGVGGTDYMVLVEMRKTSASAGIGNLLYSMCIWYEA